MFEPRVNPTGGPVFSRVEKRPTSVSVFAKRSNLSSLSLSLSFSLSVIERSTDVVRKLRPVIVLWEKHASSHGTDISHWSNVVAAWLLPLQVSRVRFSYFEVFTGTRTVPFSSLNLKLFAI